MTSGPQVDCDYDVNLNMTINMILCGLKRDELELPRKIFQDARLALALDTKQLGLALLLFFIHFLLSLLQKNAAKISKV